MQRVPPLDEAKHPELKQLVADIKGQRGRISALYGTLLNSPPIAAGWLHFLTAVRREGKLLSRYRELVILRVALVNRAPYEFESHKPHGLKAGITQQQIDELTDWRSSAIFTPEDRAVLEYTDTMSRDIEVPDASFAGVRKLFDDQEIVELTATIGAYNLVSRFLVALHVGH
jgi:AhpD family alkylhydroperoxidase